MKNALLFSIFFRLIEGALYLSGFIGDFESYFLLFFLDSSHFFRSVLDQRQEGRHFEFVCFFMHLRRSSMFFFKAVPAGIPNLMQRQRNASLIAG